MLFSFTHLFICILVGIKWYLIVILRILSIFHGLLAICISICPVFNWVICFFLLLLLSCRSSLYVLDLNSLSNVWLANIFSHFMFFDAQKLLILIWFNLSIFSFLAYAFDVTAISKVMRHSFILKVNGFNSTFSSWSIRS